MAKSEKRKQAEELGENWGGAAALMAVAQKQLLPTPNSTGVEQAAITYYELSLEEKFPNVVSFHFHAWYE